MSKIRSEEKKNRIHWHYLAYQRSCERVLSDNSIRNSVMLVKQVVEFEKDFNDERITTLICIIHKEFVPTQYQMGIE